MKETILTFLIIFIIFWGMPSVASNGTTNYFIGFESQSDAVTANTHQTKEHASSTSMPEYVILLLISTGLIGLAGLSRNYN